jgi:hypothetical protein
MGIYDAAQVCLNGHVITDTYHRSPEFRQKFCDKCGQPTIYQCPKCKTEIRGDYHVENLFVITTGEKTPPAFCFACGKPFPWVAAKIAAAQALADEVDGLTDAERITLKASIEQIAAETPMTDVAVVRLKKLIPKVLAGGGEALRRLVVDVASEAAKKSMGL